MSRDALEGERFIIHITSEELRVIDHFRHCDRRGRAHLERLAKAMRELTRERLVAANVVHMFKRPK